MQMGGREKGSGPSKKPAETLFARARVWGAGAAVGDPGVGGQMLRVGHADDRGGYGGMGEGEAEREIDQVAQARQLAQNVARSYCRPSSLPSGR